MSLEFFESVTASGDGGTPQLLVQRTPERGSWVALPPSLASQLYQHQGSGSGAALPLVLELRQVLQRAGISIPSDTPKYVAWGGACGSPGALGVPAGLLGSLGLQEGRPVVVRPLWDVAQAVAVTVEPASEDDWEMVELNAEYLEGQLLSQVGVVSPRQPFPFWVHTHLINLKVVSMDPAGAAAARLVPGTEIHIAPRVRVRPGAVAVSGQVLSGKQDRQQQARGGDDAKRGTAAGAAAAASSMQETPLETALRVQCVSASQAAKWQEPPSQLALPPSVLPVGVSPLTLARCGLHEGDWVRLVAASGYKPASAKAAGRFACLLAYPEAPVGHVALTSEQCAVFGVAPFAHVRVLRLGQSQRALVLEAAELLQTQQQAAARKEAAGAGAAAKPAHTEASKALTGVPAGRDEATASAAAGSTPAATVRTPAVQGMGSREATCSLAAACNGAVVDGEVEGISWLHGALEKAVQALLPVLASTPRSLLQAWGVPRPGGLLVSGPPGSGKSALVASAAAALQRHPQCLTYPVVVRCREVTAEGPAHVQALISAKVREAFDHMPSLLVFDDLDVLCHAESDGPEGAGSAGDPGLVAWLCDVLDYLCTASTEWGVLPPWAQQQQHGTGQAGAAAQEQTTALPANGKSGEKSGITGGKGKGESNGASLDSGNAVSRQHSKAAPSGSGGHAVSPQHVKAAPSGSSGNGRADGGAMRQGAENPSPRATSLWPPVAFVATCKDPAALAAPLRAARRLDHPLALPAPSAESRAAILAAGARRRGVAMDPCDLQAVAERADGFDAADLEVLLDRALHQALRRRLASPAKRAISSSSAVADGNEKTAAGSSSRSSSQQVGEHPGETGLKQLAGVKGHAAAAELTEGDLVAALEGMTPAAFWGVHTQKSVQQGVSGWEDVGGMEDVREALYESLELPTKYAKLVAQAPLRLRTGVLLYGPPGCGKTHVVSAAVAAAKVRCITVSGPELLNKYIGASEAAVRDVFQRAAAAAPSVLFFDEFDAIAPQRGHDNTGVTDRVVNQLLTELDGVEGLKGVCVIAATSRPDLIDAALLRPGRLDRLLYCGFPSPMERHKILAALARALPLAPDVALERLAYEAEYFTGADLSAVLSEAQLAAVHETLDAEPPSTPTNGTAAQPLHKHHHSGGTPVIAQRHLEAAMATARPSVPEDERDRLEMIYNKFQQSREPGGSALDKGKGKKVSWA